MKSIYTERRFHQKITDIYATALDYHPHSKNNKEVFCKGAEQDALCGAWSYGSRVDLQACRCR